MDGSACSVCFSSIFFLFVFLLKVFSLQFFFFLLMHIRPIVFIMPFLRQLHIYISKICAQLKSYLAKICTVHRKTISFFRCRLFLCISFILQFFFPIPCAIPLIFIIFGLSLSLYANYNFMASKKNIYLHTTKYGNFLKRFA